LAYYAAGRGYLTACRLASLFTLTIIYTANYGFQCKIVHTEQTQWKKKIPKDVVCQGWTLGVLKKLICEIHAVLPA